MLFRQIIHDDLGCASYFVGDQDAGVAAVVDPRFDIDIYLELARYFGTKIVAVLETHNHADHVSGHGRLAEATGATVYVHRANDAEYPHQPFVDGWKFHLGSLTVQAIHTPGHRPEHTAFALIDTTRGLEPWAVLSGDSLFVGDVARPDLAIEKRAGAAALYDTLHEKLLKLPPETEVWPGHLGGSLCGSANMSGKICSTVGYELAHNPLLQIDSKQRFVEQVVTNLPPQPPNFPAIVGINHGPFYTDPSCIRALTPLQVEQKGAAGALLVDVRTEQQFSEAHVPGAILITSLHAGFGTKLAWLIQPDQEVVLIGRDSRDAERAAKLAAAVGIRQLGGYLAGGMTSWRDEKLPVERTVRITPAELRERCNADNGTLQILDVRSEEEWQAGHIPGSLHIPYYLLSTPPESVDLNLPVATICAAGGRAAMAASLLQHHGAKEVLYVADGGIHLWAEIGGPIEL